MELSYIRMAMPILEILVKIKNMGKDHFSGLIYQKKANKNRSSSIMGIGGEDFLMEWVNI